jgi:hypothetical protein
MTRSRTLRALLAWLMAVQLVVLLAQAPAAGFSLEAHEAVLNGSLPVGASNPTDIDPAAMQQVIGSFFTGKGNLGSDLHQFDAFRHFDSAPNPPSICALAVQSWSFFVNAVDAATQVSNAASPDPMVDSAAARSAFGGLTHSLQDFYSHSNWIELGHRSQAPLFPTCVAGALPSELQTGYFKPSALAPLSGCPTDGLGNPLPPAPFKYCHLTLNKDKPQGHGAEIAPGSGGRTYHQVAVDLAKTHTAALYAHVRARVAGRLGPATDDVAGECVARKLFQVSFTSSCLDLTGNWTVLTTDPVTKAPPVGQTWGLSQLNHQTVGGNVLSSVCGPRNIAAFRSSSNDPFRGTVPSCPVPITGPCPAELLLPLSLTYTGRARIRGVLTAIDVEETATECREVGRQDQVFVLARIP